MINDNRYDSRYNSRFNEKISDVIEFILDKEYGEVLEFSKLSIMLGYNYEDEKERKKFKSTMGRVKNFLIDYGYILKSVTNVGYYILKPKQISGYCYHTYIRRTQGLLEKSDRILQHIAVSELTEVRREERKDVIDLNNAIYENIGDAISAAEYERKYGDLVD